MPKHQMIDFFAKTKCIAAFSLAVFLFLPGFAHAEDAHYPNDPYYRDQWYMDQIHAPEAWSKTRGEGVLVAVIDGGVDIVHPDLKNAIWTNVDEIPDDDVDNDGNGFVDDVHGWNFVRGSGDIRPMKTVNQIAGAYGHGTASASLIAGRGDNHFGIAGLAWEAEILQLVILDGDGFGNVRNIPKAIDYAIQAGADIINISVFGFEEHDAIRPALARAREAGVLIVAATGNDFAAKEGLNLDWTPTVPACSEDERDEVLGVSGTDVLDQHAAYANTGTRCVDISAPGFDITVAYPVAPLASPEYEEEALIADVNYHLNGTSLSAPLVSGSAALVKSLRPDWSGKEIFDHLLATSDAISGSRQLDDPAPLGAGRLNVGRAIRELPPAPVVRGESVPPAPREMTFTERVIKNTLRAYFHQRLLP